MLTSIILEMTAMEKVQQDFPFGESLRAFLYDTLTQHDASLGDALHSSLGPRPFTVSPQRIVLDGDSEPFAQTSDYLTLWRSARLSYTIAS